MPSRVQANWTNVQHGSTPLTRITTGSFGQGGQLLKFKGDTDQYPTVIANLDNEPHASFSSADVGTFMGIAPGTTGTLAATLNDARQVVGGAVVFAMINAVFENADTSAAHAQWGNVTGTWQAYSSDGVTNPLSFTRA